MNKELIYLGLFSFPYGYGEAAKGYKAAAERMKLPVRFIDLSNSEGWNELAQTDLSDRTVIFHKRPLNEYTAEQRKAFGKIGRKVFMTVWECDRVPVQWDNELFNVDTVITPSSYVSNAVNKTFPDKKTFNLPHYIRKPSIPLSKLPEMTIDSKEDKLNILYTNSQLTSRKGIDLMLSSYYSIPRSLHKHTRLIVKGVRGTISFCKKFMVDHAKPEISVIEDYLTDAEMDNLFYTCDIFVSPNRGEGFGMDIIKAWLFGRPLVVTDTGGYMDILDSGLVRTLVKFIPSYWDYAYCKATYHDTDVHRLKWPTPKMVDVTDSLETVINTVKENRPVVAEQDILTVIDKYNNMVDRTFKSIIMQLSKESKTYKPVEVSHQSQTPFLLMTGGIGDIINGLCATNVWKYLSDIRQKHIMLLYTHTEAARELFQAHPNRDMFDVQIAQWNDSYNVPDIIRESGLNEGMMMNNNIKWSTNSDFELPLPKDDQKALDAFLKQCAEGDYVVVHPFAGEDYKCFPPELTKKVITDLHNMGLKDTQIVVIGSTYTRKIGDNNVEMKEVLDSSVTNMVTNMVDQTSISMAIRIVAAAKAFVGAHSFGSMVAWRNDIPNLIMYSQKLYEKHWKTPDNWSFGMLKPNTRHCLFTEYKKETVKEVAS